jgi:formamidopyrimidine-DNA glycosylase
MPSQSSNNLPPIDPELAAAMFIRKEIQPEPVKTPAGCQHLDSGARAVYTKNGYECSRCHAPIEVRPSRSVTNY